MNVNFELYKVFYYVAKFLSFSTASQQLFISQSAVSQSIKTLEQQLNIQLFFRNTKQVKLTQEGQLLFRHIEQAFNLIKNGEKNLEEIQSLEKGEIRIGASDTICKYYLLPYFKKFHTLYPEIKIHVTNRTSPKCVDLLKQGNVDLIVTNLPNQHVLSTMKTEVFRDTEDTFVAGPPFAELETGPVSLKTLEKYPLLMLEKRTTTREFFDALMEAKGISIYPEVELGSIDLLIELAKIGLGITLVPTDCVEDALKSKELFKLQIEEELPKRQLGVIVLKSMPLSPAAKIFMDLLREPQP